MSDPKIGEGYLPTNHPDDRGSAFSNAINHQLIILGNGFDLACGLRSRFEDFFNPRMKKLHLCRECEGTRQFERMQDSGLTAWDIVLSVSFAESEKTGQTDWCDVELAIERFVRYRECDKRDRPFSRIDLSSIALALTNELSETKMGESNQGWLDALNSADLFVGSALNPAASENEELARYLIWKYQEQLNWSKQSLSGLMLEELHELEGAFEQYLTRELHDCNSYTRNSEELIRKLVVAEEGHLRSTGVRTTILSFNYTTIGRPVIGNTILDQSMISDVVNIHGKLGSRIIFGIDGTQSMDDPVALRYTKTYRLLGSGDARLNSAVAYPPSRYPADVQTASIKFFGHSLSKADYAYFQSLFDITELYDGRVALCFFFSDYCADEEERMYERVAALLASYGETMDNADHGKNLIHRLLMENRLFIKPVPWP